MKKAQKKQGKSAFSKLFKTLENGLFGGKETMYKISLFDLPQEQFRAKLREILRTLSNSGLVSRKLKGNKFVYAVRT